MTQNNLYMEDDEMRLYVDVQPLLLDEIENSRNAAVASAALAAQSEENARNWKNSIIDYKTSMELFYAQASDGLTNLYNNSRSELTLSKNNVLSSIEMAKRTAINNINTNGQNYVSQVQNIVDNRVSTEHLNQSKCLMTGEETTDAEAVNEAKNYAHSTFDNNKFTVAGSPVITSDGLAGGFSSSNYVSKSINFNPSASDYWEIQTKAILTEQIDAKTLLDFNDESGNTISAEIISITLSGLYPKFRVQTQSGETINVTSQTAFVLNQEYTFKIGYNANGYYCKWSSDNTTWTDMPLENRFPNDPVKPCSKLFVGWRNANHSHFWGGTIDLKQLLITVNGVSFFRGNKTGLDVIKLDSFTTTGSPSITFDGILSNTDNSNYLAANKLITYNSATNNLKIKFKCKTSSSDIASETGDVRVIYWSQSQNRLTFNKNGFLVLELGGSNYLSSEGAPDTKYYNENVDVEIICEGRKQTLKVTLSNGTVLTSSLTANSDSGFDSSAYIRLGQGILNTWGLIHGANLDLNSFRVYVDDELVYQPCLKIPYTESKTGSKVVDGIYRDRVKDVYEQGFLQRYYALDEANNKAWLPIGDIYGMIESLRKLILELTSE